MPFYTYRREDGTTFDIRQSFSDSALTHDPVTGQRVSRVVHNAGVIFKGSGFYKTDRVNSGRRNPPAVSPESRDREITKAAEPTKPVDAPAAAPTPSPAAAAAD